MEEDAKPVVEHQCRLIPKMKEVVRNEVLKLLDVVIIYPIADSRWVSPIYFVFLRKEVSLLCLVGITSLFLKGW
jgi:hypothetical protein